MTKLKRKADIVSEKKFYVAFGNQNLLLNDLKDWNPRTLNQVHGSTIVEASNKIVKADGQWTDSTQQTLVIKTADCLPIFIFDQNRVYALHAGWRGVKRRIMTKALEQCRNPQGAQIYIGPHIQMRSFQLDRESTQALLKEHNLRMSQAITGSLVRPSISQKNHYHVSLSLLVTREVQHFAAKVVFVSKVDTFLSPIHNSYRRNRLNKQRNLSFIRLKS